MDAIGMKFTDYRKDASTIYAIEAKISRNDLCCLRQKAAYRRSVDFPAVDFYYLIVPNTLTIEPDLYPMWGVMDNSGRVIKKAKRLTRSRTDSREQLLARAISHVLVYKVYGELYLPQ